MVEQALLGRFAAKPCLAYHLHHSSRWDRSRKSLYDSLTTRIKRYHSNIVTLTEVGDNDRPATLREVARDTGLRVVQKGGHPGWDECAQLYDPEVWEVLAVWMLPLAAKIPRRAGSPGVALTVLYRHRSTGKTWLWTLAHMPSGVEGDLADGRATTLQGRAWMQSLWAWKRQVQGIRKKHKPTKVSYVADWNLSLKRPFVIALMKATFPRLHHTYTRASMQKGTHDGGRPIDYTLTNAKIIEYAHILADDDSSDHRAYEEVLAA